MLDARLKFGYEQSWGNLKQDSTFRELQLVQYCWRVCVCVCMQIKSACG